MKFSEMLSSGKVVLRGAVKGMAQVADSRILEHIPIVSNILNGAQLINDALEGKEDADYSLTEVKATVQLVSPIIVKISEATDKVGDAALNDILEAISNILEMLWEQANAYLNKGKFVKVRKGK